VAVVEWLGIAVVAGFVAVIWQVQRRRQVTVPFRGDVLSQPIRFRCPVGVKYWHALGWSTKILRGMEIVVRESSVQVSTIRPSIGAALGSEWYFEASDISIEVSSAPSDLVKREWIIVQPSEPEAWLAVFARNGSNLQIWDSLLAAGAGGFGTPPQH
jgi:hypothetical protein